MAVEDGNPENVSALEKKIIRQIEYYFGDFNFNKDQFLKDEAKKDDGWITLDTMLKFNRLAQLSGDYNVITTALSKSTSGLMEISEDKTKIRRSPEKPLPEDVKKDEFSKRSIYAKGISLEASLDDIQDYFEQFGSVEHVTMRKTKEGTFKGSVFVQFSKNSEVEAILAKNELKYKEEPLILSSKDDYFERKSSEKKQRKEKEGKEKEEAKKLREEAERERFEEQVVRGAILKLTSLPAETSLEILKESFKEFAPVAWVDFEKGDQMAKIRFQDKDGAKTALEKCKEANEGDVKIKGSKVEASVLEGDEEDQHWRESLSARRDFRRGQRGGRGGRGRGGYRGGRRSNDNHGAKRSGTESKVDEPAPKVTKTE